MRVAIADDQELVRHGFRLILQASGIDVVGVVLMDVRMPGIGGIEATRELAGAGVAEPVAVLILTTFDLGEYVVEALRAGASGESLLSPSVTRRLIERFIESAPPPPPELDELTPREHEVLGLIARGRSNAEIAGELVVSEATAKTHVARILAKLRLRDRVQAVVFAYEHGIVSPGSRPPG